CDEHTSRVAPYVHVHLVTRRRRNTMTVRLVRQSLFPALAAGLLGLLVGAAVWSSPASAADAAASDFSQTPPPGQPSATVADTEHSTRLYGNNPYEEAVAVTRHTYTASQPFTA